MKKLLLIGLLLLAGCSTNINKPFATGYGLNKVSRNVNTELLNSGTIDYKTGLEVRRIEDIALQGLDDAWRIRLIYADSSKAQVAKINSTMIEVLKTLEKRQVTK